MSRVIRYTSYDNEVLQVKPYVSLIFSAARVEISKDKENYFSSLCTRAVFFKCTLQALLVQSPRYGRRTNIYSAKIHRSSSSLAFYCLYLLPNRSTTCRSIENFGPVTTWLYFSLLWLKTDSPSQPSPNST